MQNRKAAARVRIDPLAQVQHVALGNDQRLALANATLHLRRRNQGQVSRHDRGYRIGSFWLLLAVDKNFDGGGTPALLTKVSDGPHITGARVPRDDGV